MMFKALGNLPNQGSWIGPLRVMNQGDKHNIWATMGGRIFRGAPEHFRPVSPCEARNLPSSEIGCARSPAREFSSSGAVA